LGASPSPIPFRGATIFLQGNTLKQRLDATMIRNDLLNMLVCPEDQSSLSLASTELIARMNRAIARGQLQNRAGQKIEKLLSGGLLRADQSLLYPIMDEIPMMLVDEAIPMDQAALVS
jgi:uncharacterized protein YbaR (Trm112 family)